MIAGRTFVVAAAAFMLLRLTWFLAPDPSYAVLRYYGGDLLALPVFIPLSVALQTRMGIRNRSARIGIIEVLIYCVGFSVSFEVVFPQVLAGCTADPLDAVAYLFGGLTLWVFQRSPSVVASSSPRQAPTATPDVAMHSSRNPTHGPM